MAPVKDKVQHALDEGRMMVLGVQVLIGFDFRSVFEPSFSSLPRVAQLLRLGSLAVLCVSFALLVTPDAEHQIVRRGNDTAAFHRFASDFFDAALLPFAVALGIDFAVAACRLAGPRAAVASGLIAAGVALAMWYGIELARRPPRETRENMPIEGDNEPTPLHDKIRQVLTEARVALPGAQALLGFQFACILTEGFERLPQALKWLHFAALSMMSLTIILLIAPAAWHRIVERGEETERFHHLASSFIVASLVPLALGLVGDFYVVAFIVARAAWIAAILTALVALLFFGLWFGLSLIRRHGVARRRATAGGRARPAYET